MPEKYITYKEKLLDPRWQKRRLQLMEKDNFTCQWCGEKEKTLHIHHYCYRQSRNPWESEDHEMTTLCCDCHSFEHLEGVPKVIQDLHCILIINPDKNGDAIRMLVQLCLKEYNHK
jgi:hypothetical protein